MTTKVTVEANHGWPVDVTPVSTAGGSLGEKRRVPAGATEIFYVHIGKDLVIHEVQDHELKG